MGNPYFPAQLTPIGKTDHESHVAFMNAALVVLPEFGAPNPSVKTLRIFCAHWCQETGHGRFMYCYNFGNIKAYPPKWQGGITYCEGNEILPVDPKKRRREDPKRTMWMDFGPVKDDPEGILNRFRAFSDFKTGITDYFKFKHDTKEFRPAFQAALDGDVIKFINILTGQNYATADKKVYENGIFQIYTQLENQGTSPSGAGIADKPVISPDGCDPMQAPTPPPANPPQKPGAKSSKAEGSSNRGYIPYPPRGPRPSHGAYAEHMGWKPGSPEEPHVKGYPCKDAPPPEPPPPPPPPPEPPPPPPPPMPVPPPREGLLGEAEVPAVRVTASDAPTDIKVRFKKQQPKDMELVEFADVLFRRHSAVIPPDRPIKSGKEHEEHTGVGTIATCLRHASENPDAALLVAGHTDYEPDTDYLLLLSLGRAKTAHSLIVGNRDEFAQTCHDSHSIEDYQQILTFVAATRGWPCDPHGITGNHNADTSRAIAEFQKAYNASGPATPIPEDSGNEISLDTWRAFFDCYEFELAKELDTTMDGLSQVRAQLKFVQPEAVGCGNYHPANDGQYVSTSNRRVELLFFKDGEPTVDCHDGTCRPELCPIWDRGKYRPPKHVPVKPSPLPWSARWDRGMVNAGDKAQMLVFAPGVADGETFVFEVAADGQTLGSVNAAASAGIAKAEWSDFQKGATGERHYSFVARGGGKVLIPSRDLTIQGDSPPPPPPLPDPQLTEQFQATLLGSDGTPLAGWSWTLEVAGEPKKSGQLPDSGAINEEMPKGNVLLKATPNAPSPPSPPSPPHIPDAGEAGDGVVSRRRARPLEDILQIFANSHVDKRGL